MSTTARAFLQQPITSVESAEAFIRALHAAGLLFHFDDDPRNIINLHDHQRTFTDAEAYLVNDRVDEMFALEGFDPFELAVELASE